MVLNIGGELTARCRIQNIFGIESPVGPHAVAILSTEKFHHRGSKDFPRQVPQGDLYASDCGYGHTHITPGPSCKSRHLGAEGLNIQRVFPYHQIAQVAKDDVFYPPAPVGFPDSRDTAIGFDLHHVSGTRPEGHHLHLRDSYLLTIWHRHCPEVGKCRGGGNRCEHFQEISSSDVDHDACSSVTGIVW